MLTINTVNYNKSSLFGKSTQIKYYKTYFNSVNFSGNDGEDKPNTHENKAIDGLKNKIDQAKEKWQTIKSSFGLNFCEENNKLILEGRELEASILNNKVYLYDLDSIFNDALRLRDEFDPDKKYKVNGSDRAVLLKHINDMNEMNARGEGFKKIGGYQKEKDFLTAKFAVQTMGLAKTSIGDQIKIPNALLFYGPTGVGKTTFAKALAVQSLSFCEEVIPDSLASPEEIIEEIKNIAEKAKENYLNSGKEKKRTIIVVNEAQDVAKAKGFESLLANCSDKYKCTLFLTGNYPDKIGDNILKSISEEYIIPIAPPGEENTREVINKVLAKKNIDDIDKLEQRFLRTDKGIYSNTDIVTILVDTTTGKTDVKSSEIIHYIDNSGYGNPSISFAFMKTFENQKLKIAKLFKNIR